MTAPSDIRRGGPDPVPDTVIEPHTDEDGTWHPEQIISNSHLRAVWVEVWCADCRVTFGVTAQVTATVLEWDALAARVWEALIHEAQIRLTEHTTQEHGGPAVTADTNTPDPLWPPEFWTGLEQLIALAWREGWRAAEWQQHRAGPEGLWPYDIDTVEQVYEDWRTFGPGATMPGGPQYRANAKRAESLRPHRESLIEAAGGLSPEAAQTIFGTAPITQDEFDARTAEQRAAMEQLKAVEPVTPGRPTEDEPGYRSPFKAIGHDGPHGDMRLADE